MVNILEVFWRFIILGCLSFGGPAAHIGYFQTTFVERLQWLTQEKFAQLTALSQFLPGPGSSQLGFAIGLQKAGLAGGIAAFLGFTLPSFFIMISLALNLDHEQPNQLTQHVISSLKLVAVVVVADAIITMFKTFCMDKLTKLIMVLSAASLILTPSILVQTVTLICAALLGSAFADRSNLASAKQGRPAETALINWPALILFACLFVCLPVIAGASKNLNLFSDFYHAGSLVFGGGHVVLPLLQHTAGQDLSADQFLAGYAAAQAVPGPMFTLATYLGASLSEPQWGGAITATLAIFLPGFLLILAFQHSWGKLLTRPGFYGATFGVNACVVGLLIAAFYQPVLTNAVSNWYDLIFCAAGLSALRLTKIPLIAIILAFLIHGVVIVPFLN